MGEYAKEQIENSVKIEATIGLGITSIIMSYVIQGAAMGTVMPTWAILVLGVLLLTFFGVRILAYFRYIIEKEMSLREKRLEAEIQANQRKINQLTSLIIQSNKKIVEPENEDFGLFRIKRRESVKIKVRESSLADILVAKDARIKELESRVKDLLKKIGN